jgi:hypothetical protein
MNEIKGNCGVKRINQESDLDGVRMETPVEVYREGSKEIFGELEFREGLFLGREDNEFSVVRFALDSFGSNPGKAAVEVARYGFYCNGRDGVEEDRAILYEIEGPFPGNSKMFAQYQEALERLRN